MENGTHNNGHVRGEQRVVDGRDEELSPLDRSFHRAESNNDMVLVPVQSQSGELPEPESASSGHVPMLGAGQATILDAFNLETPPPRDCSDYDYYAGHEYSTPEELKRKRQSCYIKSFIVLGIITAVCVAFGVAFSGRVKSKDKVCTISGESFVLASLESGSQSSDIRDTAYFWWGAVVRKWIYANGTDITRNLQYSVNKCDRVILQGPAQFTSGAFNITRPQTTLEFRNNLILNASIYAPDYPIIPSIPVVNPSASDGGIGENSTSQRALVDFTEASGRDGCTSPPYVNVRHQPFIYILNTIGVSITGDGIIDGGGDFWSLFCGDERLTAERPVLVDISGSVDVSISGVTLDDAAMWPLTMEGSTGVTVDNVSVGTRTVVTTAATAFSKSFFYIQKIYVGINVLLSATGTELLVGEQGIRDGKSALFTTSDIPNIESIKETWPNIEDYCQVQTTTLDETNSTSLQLGHFLSNFGNLNITKSTMSFAVSPSLNGEAPSGRFDEVILVNIPNLVSLIFENIESLDVEQSLWDLPFAGGIKNLEYALIGFPNSTQQWERNTFLQEFALLSPSDWNLTTIRGF
jgi:hypothetical protein